MSIPVLVRFSHLKARRVVNNWPQLRRLIHDQGFPPGMLIGPNTRAWREDEVEDWLDSRPTATKPDPRKHDESLTAGYLADETGRAEDDGGRPKNRAPGPRRRAPPLEYPVDDPTEQFS
ncbi:helix-turn-helix transcriptional regulator [Rhizobium leguminosarum]|uniref:helix-turn-helix transcriptional regulator n=1 Tax=Rhizobium leguminosarum TaxID=384 RepID=UPI000421EF3C|nr:AlpA family phage regulatory protein [Rhizobium leguminosarum]